MIPIQARRSDCGPFFSPFLFLSPRGRKTCGSLQAGQHRFFSYYKSAKLQPMLASESILLLFATYSANTNISYATIKIYISAIRHLHVTTASSTYSWPHSSSRSLKASRRVRVSLTHQRCTFQLQLKWCGVSSIWYRKCQRLTPTQWYGQPAARHLLASCM